MAESTGTVSVASNLWTSPPSSEHGLWYDLSVGVGANFLTALLLILFLVVCEFFFKRRQLFKFFGLTQDKTLRIFIGHIPHEG
ncbi:MAG TPA: hypothetical protein VNT99_00130, partial [Methylomirabilota bacterium]|nr:hypothetical protein [Methylomirabilota bacterium]